MLFTEMKQNPRSKLAYAIEHISALDAFFNGLQVINYFFLMMLVLSYFIFLLYKLQDRFWEILDFLSKILAEISLSLETHHRVSSIDAVAAEIVETLKALLVIQSRFSSI